MQSHSAPATQPARQKLSDIASQFDDFVNLSADGVDATIRLGGIAMRRVFDVQKPNRSQSTRARRFVRRRPAIALIAVLVVTAVIATLATTFVASTGTTAAISRNLEGHAQARQIAETGVRLTLAYIRAEDDWRSQKSEGAWLKNVSMLGGTFSIKVMDGQDTDNDGEISNLTEGDGSLGDDPLDVFTVVSTAVYGDALHIITVSVTPTMVKSVRVLLVVPDEEALTQQDVIKNGFMKEWGYDVSLISASSSQAAFDSAVANADVAYISEEIVSSQLGTKLKNASIGLVNEEREFTDEYGFASSSNCFSSTTLDIVNGAHQITQGLTTGVAAILASSTEIHVAQGPGGGAEVLAERPSNDDATLLVIETGDALFGGGSAAGRRVHLPWGCDAFDAAQLNGEGKLLMRQAIEWAGEGASESEGQIFWIDRSNKRIRSAMLDGSGAQNVINNVDDGTAIAIDSEGGKVYWADKNTKNIHRANLDGTNKENLISGVNDPTALGVDGAGGKLYWANKDTKKIHRANLDGSSSQNLISGLDEVTAIAVDGDGGKIYWADKDSKKLHRANLDGSGEEHIVSNVKEGNGLAVDGNGGKLYWANKDRKRIRRADLDGKNGETLVSSVDDPTGLAVDPSGEMIYWANKDTKKIHAAELDGANSQNLINGVDEAGGVALDLGAGTGGGLESTILYAVDWH